MPAKLSCFTDENCTQEFNLNDVGNYVTQLGNGKVLDGSIGAKNTCVIYIKNTGNRAALHTTFTVDEGTLDFIAEDTLELGDFKELEVKSVTLTVKVPKLTNPRNFPITLTLDYYTLPDIDEVFYNPYQDTREVAE